ncbi:MAG: MBL fold metallo-hydrolase [Treponema sp.]|nr:MAG: MBL fold metallo-hydrolase [Treponema sp.]
MELLILGSGTSHGIPVIGCSCPVCVSNDPRDSRTRASALIRGNCGESILVDAGPEFRIQAIRAGIRSLDAVLATHAHADHIHGLDDIRIFSARKDMDVWGNTECIEDIRERFAYIFRPTQEGGGKPHLKLRTAGTGGEPIVIGSLSITPIPLFHGTLPILGWRAGDTAYLTDCNQIPESSFALLDGTRKLVIDALRARTHSTHYNFEGALAVIERIGAEVAWFTHICHDFSHEGIREWLRLRAPGKKIEPAYDGLCIRIE